MSLGTPKFQWKKPRNHGNFLTQEGSMVGDLTYAALLQHLEIVPPWGLAKFSWGCTHVVSLPEALTTMRNLCQASQRSQKQDTREVRSSWVNQLSSHLYQFLDVNQHSANKGLPLPFGRGVCETKSKNGRSRPRKPFISRVLCAGGGLRPWSQTMVSDPLWAQKTLQIKGFLGLGRPFWIWSRRPRDQGVGVDPFVCWTLKDKFALLRLFRGL